MKVPPNKTPATVAEIVTAAHAEVEAGFRAVGVALAELRPRPNFRAPIPPPPDAGGLTILQRIAAITEADRTGRRVVAGLGLVELQRWIAAGTPGITAEQVPLDPARVEALVGLVRHKGSVLVCVGCGALAACACACGACYLPEYAEPPEPAPKASALARARAALEIDPTRSNRAIARQIGVNYQTVRRARLELEARPGGVS